MAIAIIAYISAWLGINIGIFFIFEKLEENLRPETRADISNWLNNLNPEERAVKWAATLASAFNGIFGEKHFSLRCFRRSCYASCVAVFIFGLLWFAIYPKTAGSYFRNNDVFEVIGTFLGITVIFNIVTDYASLLETGWIISKLKYATSPTKIIGYLIIDLFLTVIIMLVTSALIIFIFMFLFGIYDNVPICSPDIYIDYYNQYMFMLKELYYGITLSSSSHPNPDYTLGIWLYSTFFTSIWIYLYVISGWFVKVGAFSGILVGFMRRIFDIDNRPLRSMGCVGMLIVSIGFFIASFPILIF